MTAKTDDEAAPAAEVTLVENVLAPEVYADEAAFFFLKKGNIEISFVSARMDATDDSGPPYPIRRVVIGRLVMPLASAQSLSVGLYDFLAQRGLAPPKPDAKKTN